MSVTGRRELRPGSATRRKDHGDARECDCDLLLTLVLREGDSGVRRTAIPQRVCCFAAVFTVIQVAALLIAHGVFAGTATWVLNPTSSDWNTAVNWTPSRIPDGPRAVAAFAASNVTDVVNGETIVVERIAFTAAAGSYSITVGPQDVQDFDSTLTFNGTGVINDSGVAQNFANSVSAITSGFGQIIFMNDATAGDRTTFTNNAGANGAGKIIFSNASNAGSATFLNQAGHFSPSITFNDDSSAANATFTNEGGTVEGGLGGLVRFADSATAGTASVTLLHGGFRSGGGFVSFSSNSTADHATITAEGANDNPVQSGQVAFNDTATAGNAAITLQPGVNIGASGGNLSFYSNSTAGDSTLIAANGFERDTGARINFFDDSLGGTARLEILGPGSGSGLLLIDQHNAPGISVGSIEGSGAVSLGQNNLTVGTNNLTTSFAGTIKDGENGSGGSLTKTGTGTLTLSGANSYTGTTTINQGVFLAANATGSATGPGTVNVNSGTLGGRGVISGALTIGTGSGAGALLAPAFGSSKQVTLTVQASLTLQADATYIYTFKARSTQSKTDLLVADGVVITGARIKLKGKTQGTLTPGLILTVITNTSANPITGTFSNLADGAIVNVNGNNLQASYIGGDGNDLTLTVVP